jgi:hypothetical protein
MNALEEFFRDIDARWSRSQSNPLITLHVIGSTALMMLAGMRAGTTDSDIIETAELDEDIKRKLLDIAGPGSECERRFGLHLQFVARGIPLLPQAPRYRAIDGWRLAKIKIKALDPVDVAVSKLKLLRPRDKADISMLVQEGHITHDDLLRRFKSAVEIASMSARADDLPQIIARFHRVERDEFGLEPTPIDLPDHLDR